ncbi:MAG: hypothetical protein IKM65_07475 [Bacteroidaceae bacterium]|nr:hypothetical protein [Bacteroidaceae bacterium]
MKLKRLLITILVSIVCSALYSQTNGTETIETMQDSCIAELPMLSAEYYMNINSMNRAYDFEMQNKKRMLRMRAAEVEAVGVITTLGLYAATVYVATGTDVSMWVAIPCGVALTMTIPYPFFRWGKRLREKAAAIDASTVYLLDVNKNIKVGVSHFSCRNERTFSGIGLGIKTTF